MKKTLLSLVLATGLVACDSQKTETPDYYWTKKNGTPITEEGTVTSRDYTPSRHLNPMDDFRSSMNPMYDIKHPLKAATKSQERYDVTIQYSQGKFSLNNEQIYDSTTLGEKVKVTYSPILEVYQSRTGFVVRERTVGYTLDKVVTE